MYTCKNKLKCALREKTCCVPKLKSLAENDMIIDSLDVKCIMDHNRNQVYNLHTGTLNSEGYPNPYIHKIFCFNPSVEGVLINSNEGLVIELPLDEIDGFLKNYCPFLHEDCKYYIANLLDRIECRHKVFKWEYEKKMRECNPMMYIDKQDEKYFIR